MSDPTFADHIAAADGSEIGLMRRLIRSPSFMIGAVIALVVIFAAAISYVETAYPGGKLFGAGISTNIVGASLEAIVSAANRVLEVKAGKH